MMGQEWISLLLQVPLVGVFIYFALQQQKIFNAYLERREESWQRFLREERDALIASLNRLASEVKAVNDEVKAVREDLRRRG